MPSIWQGFVASPPVRRALPTRRLYVARRVFEQSSPTPTFAACPAGPSYIKVCSFVKELRLFYPDLQDTDYESAIGMVPQPVLHQHRPPVGTAPTPTALSCQNNGEINTIRGNVDLMLAREETIGSNYLKRRYDEGSAHRTREVLDFLPSWTTPEFMVGERHGICRWLLWSLIPNRWGENNHSMDPKSVRSIRITPPCWNRGTARFHSVQ